MNEILPGRNLQAQRSAGQAFTRVRIFGHYGVGVSVTVAGYFAEIVRDSMEAVGGPKPRAACELPGTGTTGTER